MSSSKGVSDSDSDSDDGFNEDMEALRRACQLTGETPASAAAAGGIASEASSSEGESDGDEDNDLQLVRSIQNRFAVPMDVGEEPLKMKPLCTVLPDLSDSDDIEEDYETLRAIQRRFAAYNDGSLKENFEGFSHRPEQVGATIIDSEKETSNSFVERTNAREGFLNCVDTSEPTGKKVEVCDNAGGSSDTVEWNELGVDDVAELPLRTSHFPNSALAFVDAIKKNRSCQKLIRSKMMQMEARMEELGKLIERVRILKDFQVDCKKRRGRALSQKKDHRVQLISVPKLKANMKPNEKNIPASYKGPRENVHVPNYKEALATFSIPFNKEKWSKEERENLLKGVKQQFQEMLLQQSVDDLYSEADGYYDSSNVDNMMKSIKDCDITPERMRQFSPKVNWDQLAAMYVPRRTGAECQARFFNSEDPLINHGPWTAMEDKNLLHIIQEKGLINWIDIAASLGTNRTPFQCLARYQRSLNASILKREWTNEDDNKLRAAIETYGESNWQAVANAMEGRRGTQCSNRWLKTLHPTRERSGKWTLEEDKRLKVAVTLFGPKTWRKVANCVPGRTHVQCRERWVNCLDPSLNKAEWTEEEDLKLEEAIAKHGYCWSKVAACIPHRTDNLCLRRWKVLFPADVPQLQTARKITKAALISNFVDRESERPALGPKDFQLPETLRIAGNENVDPSMRKRKRSRRRGVRQCNEEDTLSGEIYSEEVLRLTDGSELEIQGRSMRRAGRHKSSRLRKSNARPSSDIHLSGGPETGLLDIPEGEEITEIHVSDGNNMRKSQPLKKRSGKNPTTSVAVIGDEACMKQYEHFDPIEEPTPDVPLDAELGGDNAIITQIAKASKLQPRRRNSQLLKEVQQTKPEAPRQAVTKRQMKKDKKLTDATNDHPSSLSEDTKATEAGCMKEKIGHSPRKRKKSSQILILYQRKRQKTGDGACSKQMLVKEGFRSDDHACQNQASEVEVGDGMTLAQFLQQTKEKRKLKTPL
ncbi:uncharacterized protein LOC130990303 isoform X2 [Salvia miltiorrhiza]|uniref:uncharacterized protein LOC130990303 isoform X2 n=1 Tax=Salvia miltiorrhiza TaxID=226208 RepID=UPI0025AC7438|nr:uncharacterized protein LOC130990303 isoform X2 [Salvia miltiorrhiza]